MERVALKGCTLPAEDTAHAVVLANTKLEDTHSKAGQALLTPDCTLEMQPPDTARADADLVEHSHVSTATITRPGLLLSHMRCEATFDSLVATIAEPALSPVAEAAVGASLWATRAGSWRAPCSHIPARRCGRIKMCFYAGTRTPKPELRCVSSRGEQIACRCENSPHTEIH
eukprot:gnl/Chilomastix_cuspidata/4731.p3 GENE.gnl/Chilomastix_cuspidata/4731~~gnl/Chilomastix_cuspidata/4731.p3  ORF type:complete len:172 (-),score=15.44 gnl/Chilomastix_cuspidata/4731:283-798(-)